MSRLHDLLIWAIYKSRKYLKRQFTLVYFINALFWYYCTMVHSQSFHKSTIMSFCVHQVNSLPADKLQEIQKAIELFSVGQGPAKTMEEATRRSYQFWDTQPVPKLGIDHLHLHYFWKQQHCVLHVQSICTWLPKHQGCMATCMHVISLSSNIANNWLCMLNVVFF